MPYGDLREYLDALDKAGELQIVNTEVDWDLEIGAICRHVLDTGAPAPLFQKVKGYPGFKIVGVQAGLSARNKFGRLALSLDMPVESTWKELTEEYVKRKKKRIPPKVVEKAPCQENVYIGDDIDLFSLPSPMVHMGDGGRYPGTWHAVITKDPETGWLNYGEYRQMIYDKKTLSIPNTSNEHMFMQARKYRARGEKMPWAAAIGLEPVLQLCTIDYIPDGIDELDVAGGVRGAPIEIVKCKTVDLYVPATAEIIIEGYLDPDEKRVEGPFADHAGYMGEPGRKHGVGHVTAITYRNNPILSMSIMGVPVDDSHVTMNFCIGSDLVEELRDQRGLPIDFINLPFEGCHHLVVVSINDMPYRDFPYDLAMSVFGTRGGTNGANYLILVNNDIDVTDMEQVIWAMITRADPAKDIFIVPRGYAARSVPWSGFGEHPGSGGRVLIDATWPADWPKEKIPAIASFECSWPKNIQELVLSKWKEYGFK